MLVLKWRTVTAIYVCRHPVYRGYTCMLICMKVLLVCDWFNSVQLTPNHCAIFCNHIAIFCYHFERIELEPYRFLRSERNMAWHWGLWKTHSCISISNMHSKPYYYLDIVRQFTGSHACHVYSDDHWLRVTFLGIVVTVVTSISMTTWLWTGGNFTSLIRRSFGLVRKFTTINVT
jgi:hypothetical protein